MQTFSAREVSRAWPECRAAAGDFVVITTWTDSRGEMTDTVVAVGRTATRALAAAARVRAAGDVVGGVDTLARVLPWDA